MRKIETVFLKGRPMSLFAKNRTLSALLIISLFCLATVCLVPVVQGSPDRDEEISREDAPYQHAKIFIEAFLVEVKLEALYAQGVNPIGWKPNSVTAQNILKSLKTDEASLVTEGAKLAIANGAGGTAHEESRRHITTTHGERSTTKSYSSEINFSARARVVKKNKIHIEYSFSQEGYKVQEKIWPIQVERSWSGKVIIENGRPTIIGATQNKESGIFLVITADYEE